MRQSRRPGSPGRLRRASYQARIVDLRIQNGLVTIPKAIEYACNDNRVPFSAAFYSEEPRAAVLTLGDDQADRDRNAAANGTRYVAKGVEFREKAGKVRVEFHGNALDCTAKPWRISQSLARIIHANVECPQLLERAPQPQLRQIRVPRFARCQRMHRVASLARHGPSRTAAACFG